MNKKRIHLPDVRQFDQLFEKHAPWPRGMNVSPPWPGETWTDTDWLSFAKQPKQEPCTIGPYCSMRGRDPHPSHGSLCVKPRPEVVDTIKQGTIFVAHDTMHFEVIEWDDGQALVTCSHGVIIGGLWLAVIDAATIPNEAWRVHE